MARMNPERQGNRPDIPASVDECDVFGARRQSVIEHVAVPIYAVAFAKSSTS